MYYVVEYQICASIPVLIILINFYSKHRFPLQQNKLYGGFVIVVLSNIVLDIASAYAISFPNIFPLWVSEVFNMLNYYSNLLMPVLFFMYVANVSQSKNSFKFKNTKLLYIPTIIFAIILTLNPIFPLFFETTTDRMFLEGSLFWTLPFNFIYYAMLGVYVSAKDTSKVAKNRVLNIVFICVVTSIAVGINVYIRNVLLTGVAAAVAVIVLYLSLQNPAEAIDEMTGVYNKSCFMYYIRDLDEKNKNYCVIYTNIDDTKVLNATYGLCVGSEVLIGFANHLKNFDGESVVFRITGDQFALVLFSNSDCKNAVSYIKNYFETPYRINNMDINHSACICYLLDSSIISYNEELLVIMEYMMSKAKSIGQGITFEINDIAMKERQREIDITNAFTQAVESESLEVYLQPIYSPQKNKFIAAEALCRFNHSILGYIPPDEFIRIAEKNGLILKIGLLVLKKVCIFLKENPDIIETGLKTIEINLSPIEVIQDNLAEKIIAIIKQYDIDPSLINFEITETTATTIEVYVKQNMITLNENGFSFALDDFGTGYSNFDSIMCLPFSIIKIDRRMLLGYFKNQRSATIFSNTVNLIKKLGLKVVVEGAETQEHIDMLFDLDVDCIQGYYYSRAIPFEDFKNFIFKNNKKEIKSTQQQIVELRKS